MREKQQYSLIFAGTGAFGVPVLEALVRSKKFKIPFVITAPDKPAGRSLALSPPPIKNAAIANKLFVQQPRAITELKQKITEENPDFLLVADYGEIIKKEILDIPKFGAINIHPSLLPLYRGATPVQEAILKADKKTGITWILMNEHLDAGDIIAQMLADISDSDTYETLSKKLSLLAADMTPEILTDFAANRRAHPQNHAKAAYCKKIAREDGALDPNKETAEQMLRKIRAYIPWPGCHIVWRGRRLKIIQARALNIEQKISSTWPIAGELRIEKEKFLIGTLSGALDVITVQPESKKPMSAVEFLRGAV